MKKSLLSLTIIAVSALLAVTGCSKPDSESSTEGATTAPAIDVAQIESAFSGAAEADTGDVKKAIAAVKAGDYAGAVASLKAAASNLKFTPEQQKAVKDLLAQVQAKLGAAAGQAVDAVKKAGEDAGKAAGDAVKAVGDAAKDAAKDAGDAAKKAVNP